MDRAPSLSQNQFVRSHAWCNYRIFESVLQIGNRQSVAKRVSILLIGNWEDIMAYLNPKLKMNPINSA